MLSSYQRLKFKKDLAVKVAEELKEDIEFIIMRPHTARAKIATELHTELEPSHTRQTH